MNSTPIDLNSPNLQLQTQAPVQQPAPGATQQNPAQVYVVKPGDTLSRIAEQMGVQPNMLTGYSSGNPNLIRPGEQISVGQQPNPVYNAPPQLQIAPQTQVQPQIQPQVAQPNQDLNTDTFNYEGGIYRTNPDGSATLISGSGQPSLPKPSPAQNQQQPTTIEGQKQTFQTPSGATVDERGNIIQEAPKEKPSVFSSPLSAFTDVYKNIYKELGLVDVKGQYDKLTKQYADLQNQMDREVEAVNQNPWISGGSRDIQTKKIQDRYERKTEILTNQLKLYDDLYTSGRQEAQFVAQQAIGAYYKQAELDQKAIERAEKAAEVEYSIQEVGGRKKRFGFDKTGDIVSETDLGSAEVGGMGQYTEKQNKFITTLNENVSKNDTYKKTNSMRASADNVLTALALGSGVGDIAAINQFQKVIDEGAVTRDQDVKLIQSAQSLKNSLETKVASLQRGEQLSTTQRQQMKTLVTNLYNTQVEALKKDPYIKSKLKEVEIGGIKADDTILGELGGFDKPTGVQSATNADINYVDSLGLSKKKSIIQALTGT